MRGRFTTSHKARAQLHNMGVRNASRQAPALRANPVPRSPAGKPNSVGKLTKE
ncbi:MAG TPA: hypothetical protein VJ673_14325 [Aromatoleum sp.]|uniref:hypothetical protein n=1 Tax=Aromatoleum sp. TaxID=2307007 RepID=UPI002B4A133C|nr:hypothetical protein [Aromatoleum sp.]HJV26861.1 hypothetical protein [Aromatoleum sp.]